MKKAKILVPAIAALVLSSAAAVTGTVAWFTANLTASTASNTISVVKSGSDLKAFPVAGYGTTTAGTEGAAVTHGKFIDGSVDLATGNVYKAKFNKTGTQCTEFLLAENGIVAGETIHSATKFSVDLKMDLKDEDAGQKYQIYVDPSQLVPALDTATGSEAQSALRVGFKAGTEWVLWAPYLDHTQDAKKLSYVNNTTIGAETGVDAYTEQYAVDDRILSTEATVTAPDKLNKLYMGEITRPEPEGPYTATLRVDVYTWFEGSVLHNLSTGLGNDISYTIGFNAVKVTGK